MQAQTCFLSVLWAKGLPRLKTLLRRQRRFYVTVTNGTIVKKTTVIRSMGQAVAWDKKFDAL